MNIIIGAGISGLSYAAFSKEDYLILEGSDAIGGYCKTTKAGEFTWDYAGHFFHFNDNTIKDFVFSRMKSQKIHDVNKITKIKFGDKYIDFPFQKNIHQLPKTDYSECLVGLIEKEEKESYSSFKDMVLGKFGAGICEKFLIPYNEKLYSTDLDSLDPNAMGRFFPYADIKEIILNAKNKDNSSYNSKFIYPEGGAIEFVNAIASEVDSSKILLNKTVVNVDLNNKCVKTSDGSVYQYDKLINTSPLTDLYSLANINFEKDIYSSNSVLVFNIGFDKPANFNHHWVYFPNKETCFYRIGYYNNILSEEKMSLYVELGSASGASVDSEQLLEAVIKDLKKEGVITNQKVINWQFIKMDPAYVHINSKSEDDKVTKKALLAEYGVFSIGRYGSWTYCSIEDNIIEAKALVEQNEEL